MNDEDFVKFCYKNILRRSVNDKEGRHIVEMLKSRQLTRKDLLKMLFNCSEYDALPKLCQEFVPAGHFYSAISSLYDRKKHLTSHSKTNSVTGIDLNVEKQFELLKQFKQYHDECPFPIHKTGQFRFYYENPAYSYGDALVLHSMIRHFKPQRIIEIGSGYSSCVMLDTNEHFLSGAMSLSFVEPYPDLLRSLMNRRDKKHLIIQKSLQDVEVDIFKTLTENDILFIDSTHVLKLNSDVNRIFSEVLPALRKGVLIHFHDIFWPFEYPDDWILEGRCWNEAYILRAFLEYNNSFEILFFSSFLQQQYPKQFFEAMPLCLKNAGGNIWMRKNAH